MTEINTNLDTTPLPPNNLLAQDPQSAELAGYVRTKTFGRDVREAIARSIELNSTRSKSAEILANETVNVANDLTDRFNQQIGALTEDSEVIDARGGKTTLGQRLDETDEQLERTVPKVHEELFASDFGVVGDGVADDTLAIQLAIDESFNQNKNLRLNGKSSETPVYRITSPIIIKSKTESENPFNDIVRSKRRKIYGLTNAIFKKDGQETYEDIDCVIYLQSTKEDQYFADLDFENIEVIGNGQGDKLVVSNTTMYGMYWASGVFGMRMNNVLVRGCDYGYYNNIGTFMTTFDQVRAYTKEYGFYINGGTSIIFSNCYCQLQQQSAYRIYSIYSSMIACGADGVHGISYDLYYCVMNLIGCGSENGWGESVYKITGGNVTVTNGFHLINYNFDEAVTIKAYGNAHVVFENTKFTTVLNDSIPEKVAFGKLFTIASNAYIEFNNCNYPNFNLESNWVDNARTKLVYMKNNESCFYPSLMKPVWRFNNDYVDGSGLFAFDKTILDGSQIDVPYIVSLENNSYKVVNTSSGVNITGNTNGSIEKFSISFPFNSAKNFRKADIEIDFISSNELGNSGRGAYINIILQSKSQLGTAEGSIYSLQYENLNGVKRFSNIFNNVPDDSYLTFICNLQPWGGVQSHNLYLTIKKIRFYD